MAFKNTAIFALAALASPSFASPALPTDTAALASMMTDTAALASMYSDPAFKASMSDALNSLNDYLSKHPGALSSLSEMAGDLPTDDAAKESTKGGDASEDSTKSGASNLKPAAVAAAGLSLLAALF
ncbi:hypothetical protein GGF43_005466 [Coemansia sp. RSA 2618]|nr:hypothetical protein GGF43_005466 [Coemansia sp. RSA 2618]